MGSGRNTIVDERTTYSISQALSQGQERYASYQTSTSKVSVRYERCEADCREKNSPETVYVVVAPGVYVILQEKGYR